MVTRRSYDQMDFPSSVKKKKKKKNRTRLFPMFVLFVPYTPRHAPVIKSLVDLSPKYRQFLKTNIDESLCEYLLICKGQTIKTIKLWGGKSFRTNWEVRNEIVRTMKLRTRRPLILVTNVLCPEDMFQRKYVPIRRETFSIVSAYFLAK